MKEKNSIKSELNGRAAARVLCWASLVSTLTLAACGSLGHSSPEYQVRQLANERWQALRAGQFDQAYTYNTSAYKLLVSPEAYRARFGSAVKWVSSEVTAVTCPEPSECKVSLRIEIQPLAIKDHANNLSSRIDETWMLDNGKWSIFQPINAH